MGPSWIAVIGRFVFSFLSLQCCSLWLFPELPHYIGLTVLASWLGFFLLPRASKKLQPRRLLPGLDRRAVLISGCDTGFGNLCARRLDAMGVSVYAGCLFPAGPGAQGLKNTCSQNLHLVPLDVTKDEDMHEAVRQVQDTLGHRGECSLLDPLHLTLIDRTQEIVGHRGLRKKVGHRGECSLLDPLHLTLTDRTQEIVGHRGECSLLDPLHLTLIDRTQEIVGYRGECSLLDPLHLTFIDRTQDTLGHRGECSLLDPLHLTLIDRTQEKVGHRVLWAVVNNAGIGSYGEVEWSPLDLYLRMFQVNALGTVRMTKTFLPLVRECRGRVVCVASLAGNTTSCNRCRYVHPNISAYSMSKSAVLAFVDGLRREMDKWSVTVVSIEPALYRTRISDEATMLNDLEKVWASCTRDVQAVYGEQYFQNTKTELQTLLTTARPGLHEVVDDMVDAILGADPKLRYVPGFDVQWQDSLMSCLTTELQDKVITRPYKLIPPAPGQVKAANNCCGAVVSVSLFAEDTSVVCRGY
uniref:Uncharacterized protein n=1 Tax=Timema monikensis TaxID=170555 RepID=A0A7R9EBH4_9NEOP|nr:unnamed protein product [Timema monikensis]